MSRFPSKWLIAAGALAVLVLFGCVSSFLVFGTYEYRDSLFGNINFRGQSGNYHSVSSFGPGEIEIYVEIPGEGRFPVQAIPQDVLDRVFEVHKSPKETIYSGYGHGWSLTLTFKESGLQSFHGYPMSFSRTLDGPYLSFPISYRDLHSAWGEPDRIHSLRRIRERSGGAP